MKFLDNQEFCRLFHIIVEIMSFSPILRNDFVNLYNSFPQNPGDLGQTRSRTGIRRI